MILIALVLLGGVVVFIRQLGVIENAVGLFMAVTVFIVIASFIMRDKLSCPFAKKCPFGFCPLHKSK